MRIRQPGDDPRLVEEAGHHGRVTPELGSQDLHRDGLAQHQVGGLVDRAKPPVPQRFVQLVLLFEHLP